MPKKSLRSRAPAHSLVQRVCKNTRPAKSWYDILSDEDREYVDAVVGAAACEPDPHLTTLGLALKEELGLSISARSVSDKLREKIRYAKETN